MSRSAHRVVSKWVLPTVTTFFPGRGLYAPNMESTTHCGRMTENTDPHEPSGCANCKLVSPAYNRGTLIDKCRRAPAPERMTATGSLFVAIMLQQRRLPHELALGGPPST